jgi:CheY-like chemotaxis protein
MAKILVIDDEDSISSMLAALILDLGHEAVVASSAVEALQRLAAEQELPDLIITDLMMPQLSGTRFARALKASPHLSAIPVILMSAGGSPPREDGLINAFIRKPFSIETMIACIEQYLPRQGGPSHTEEEAHGGSAE